MSNAENSVISEHNDTQEPELRGYKTVCVKLGLSMCAFFVCRILSTLVASAFAQAVGRISPVLIGFIYYTTVILLVYIVPLLFTVILFNYVNPPTSLYKKPQRLARALGTFPAAYGLGYGVALLTLLASYIISMTTGGDTHIEQLLRPTAVEPASSVVELIMTVVLLVIVAPIFEEFWVRGIMFDALRPYGAGMAIIISSILFGLMHGSLYMLFYTTALGFALGYIRYATGSLFIVTVLHAMVNSVAAMILLLQSLVNMTDGQYRGLNTINMIFTIAVLVLIVVGVAVFFAKIPTIRKYKFENNWTQIGPWKKFGVFLISVPILIMMVLAFNELSGHMLLNLFIN